MWHPSIRGREPREASIRLRCRRQRPRFARPRRAPSPVVRLRAGSVSARHGAVRGHLRSVLLAGSGVERVEVRRPAQQVPVRVRRGHARVRRAVLGVSRGPGRDGRPGALLLAGSAVDRERLCGNSDIVSRDARASWRSLPAVAFVQREHGADVRQVALLLARTGVVSDPRPLPGSAGTLS